MRSPSATCRVLSEIHSSFTASLLRGRMRITSRPRVSTRMARADRIHDVDALGLAQLPRPRRERPGPVRQRADRTQVDHVGRQLRHHAALEVGGDLHVLAAADGAELLDARHLGHVAHAARALDAARHGRLDERPQVLLLHRALVLGEARAADAEGHGLVLQVALPALVADRAVERVVDEQELHHAFARLLHHRRLGVDDLGAAVPVGRQIVDAHGAGGDRLRHALHLDQAHAAVAGDRQALVIAEARDLDAGLLAGLDQRDAVLDLDGHAVDDQLLGHCRFRSLRTSSRHHAAPDGLAVNRISTPSTRPPARTRTPSARRASCRPAARRPRPARRCRSSCRGSS